MSADLFAEFAPEPGSNQQQKAAPSARAGAQPPPPFGFFDDLSTTPAPSTQWQPPAPTQHFHNFTTPPVLAPANEDTDDWGDFEGGSSALEPPPPATQDPFAFASNPPSRPAQTSQNSFSTQHDPFAFQPVQPSQSTQQAWQKAPVSKAKKPADSSELFDAEEDHDDDDDFGDFEGTDSRTEATAPVANASALADLLGDLNVSQPAPLVASSSGGRVTGLKAKAGFAAREGSMGGFGVAPKTKHSSSVPAARREDDGWDTFDDWEASIPTPAAAKSTKKPGNTKPNKAAMPSITPAPILSSTSNDPQPGELPPTNVPPPGVLLTLFPPLFAEAQEKLFKPMAAQTLPMRNKLLAEPATIEFLQGYLMLASATAHIIAGRKLRWKRDQHLSQGMRIGPASSRGTSGMKLAGIDKGENLKEEREVSDVVRVWKEQVGRLRHVVSGANQIRAGTLGAVPDLQETMPVRTLKQSEGGVPARQPCMMCGLKRDERVTAADMEIEDSFGEWWIDQVNMHRGCRNLWNEHRDKLRQR